MPKYRVNYTKQVHFSMEVEAENEEAAQLLVEEEELPEFCAQCVGWGRDWGIDTDDEWMTPTDFHGTKYNEEHHGKDVELIT